MGSSDLIDACLYPAVRGLNAELYNPSYFLLSCVYVPAASRNCFKPIYGLGCQNDGEAGYGQPVAFWTSVHADVAAPAPGVVAARSAVFGFPPVYFKPSQVKPAIEHILFDEWQLQRK